MVNNKNGKEYECVFCKNNDFEVPEDIIAKMSSYLLVLA